MAAAAKPRVAAHNSFDGKPGTIEEAMFLQGFNCIMGAGRAEAADITEERGDTPLVDTNKSNGDSFHIIWNTWTTSEMITSITISQMIVHSSRLECTWLSSVPSISNKS